MPDTISSVEYVWLALSIAGFIASLIALHFSMSDRVILIASGNGIAERRDTEADIVRQSVRIVLFSAATSLGVHSASQEQVNPIIWTTAAICLVVLLALNVLSVIVDIIARAIAFKDLRDRARRTGGHNAL